jgi:hypothetical protein
MTKTTINFDVTIPEGYEWSGEVRCPKKGELYLSGFATADYEGEPMKANYDFSTGMYPILRKVEVWVDFTLEKAIELYKSQKPVTYRHRGARSDKEVSTVSGVYRSASDNDCVFFPTHTNRLGIKHALVLLEILKETN